MIQLTELHFSLSLCGMFFVGALLTAITAVIIYRTMAKIKDNEISELVRKIAENELTRREQADSLRKVSLKYTNIKREIKKLIKEEDYPGPLVGKERFLEVLKGVIDE